MEIERESWRFVGRGGLVSTVLDQLGSSSVVLMGQAGVGKTRLAHEVSRRFADAGGHVERAAATSALQQIPFGAFSHLLPPMTSSDLLHTLQQAARSIDAHSGERQLLVVVDDAHQLDDASLALVDRLVSHTGARLLLTLRLEENPAAIAEMLKDGLVKATTVPPLQRTAHDELVRTVLGVEPEPELLQLLWRLTQGNPLYLRELLHAGSRSGAIQIEDSLASLAGDLEPSKRLVEIIEARLMELSSPHRWVLEVLSIAEPLDAQIVEQLANPGVLADLERARLIEVEGRDGHDAVLRLHHPIYAEVLRSRISAVARRYLTRQVIDLLTATAEDDPAVALNVATWQLELGEEIEADLAELAAREALARGDAALASRLAALALQARPTVGTLIHLGTARSVQGQVDAQGHLERALELASTDSDRVRATLALARHLTWVGHRFGAASDLLRAVVDEITDPRERGSLQVELASHAAISGDMTEALTIAEEAATDDRAPEPVRITGLVWSTLARSMLGAFDEIEEQIREGEGLARRHRSMLPFALDQLRMNRVFHLRFVDARRALSLAQDGTREALTRKGLTAAWMVTMSWIELVLARPGAASRTAARGFDEAVDFDPFNNLPMARGLEAQAWAMRGNLDQAHACLEELEPSRLEPRSRVWFDRAEVWTLAASGDREGAVRRALESSRRASDRGLTLWAAELAFNAVRLGATDPSTTLIDELSTEMANVPAIDAYRQAAAAVAEGEADSIADASAALTRVGELAAAIDLLAVGSARVDGPDSHRLAARAFSLLGAGDGYRSPLLPERADPLTDRERQVGSLAASGLSSREIADHLYVSVRTVDNHLARVYRKLGLGGREELPLVFPAAPA